MSEMDINQVLGQMRAMAARASGNDLPLSDAGAAERQIWHPEDGSDIAQAWMDDRILTDHGVLLCPLTLGHTVTLGNAARANYDKYDITNEARVDRRTYLAGQQVIDPCDHTVPIQ